MKKILILLLWITVSTQIYASDKYREPDSFVLQCTDGNIIRAYDMALTVVEGNIKLWQHGLLDTSRPVLMAGKGYARPWTRDASYNTFFCAGLIYPEIARNTLLSVLLNEDNVIRIGGQYWDCISWVTGAWAYYTYTGDKDFLQTAYSAAVNSLAYFRQREFDNATGLFFGPGWSDGVGGYPKPYNNTGGSSFILDYAKHNAHIDKIRMKALSTNCLYYNAYRKAEQMGKLLDRPAGECANLAEKADALKVAINRHLWINSTGHFAYFLDAKERLDHSQEGLGHAQAILFGVADRNRAELIFKNQYVSPHGIPCTWPLFRRFSNDRIGRHCGTVWPQIQGFWALAAASEGKLAIMDREFKALTNMAIASNDFSEIYHPFNGQPYGGFQVGRLWRSQPAQTWAATAYIAMIYQGMIGMRFDSNGLFFKPLVPSPIVKLSLTGIKYRGMTLDVKIYGSGIKISKCTLDDRIMKQPRIAVNLTGHHVITIYMENDTER
jgi:glycogen debranching enzyme